MKTYKVSTKHYETLEGKVFTIKSINKFMLQEKLTNIQWQGYTIYKVEEIQGGK